ncbi:hypothetical protein L208DRAFT_1381786 [Tricholoma matsutake]|nr:hypothetical protein L208DRAFT_1381786 [Tricholoma matsutake 945]
MKQKDAPALTSSLPPSLQLNLCPNHDAAPGAPNMPRLKKTPAEAAATCEEKARGKEEQGKKHSEETQRETNPCATMAKPAQSKKVTPAYEEFVMELLIQCLWVLGVAMNTSREIQRRKTMMMKMECSLTALKKNKSRD